MTDDTLMVSEIFGPTIQGEGPATGYPAVFLRLMGCNLGCVWCDTPYTWDASRFDLKAEGTKMTVEAVAKKVNAFPIEQVLVISGGEPMLQQRSLMALTRLIPSEREVHIETAGTIAPIPMPVSYVVSPKLAHSGNSVGARYQPHAIEAFLTENVLAWKFVVQSPEDYDEVDTLVDAFGLRPVYIMPEGVTAPQVRASLLAIVDGAIERGYVLTPRLHIDIWDGARGH